MERYRKPVVDTLALLESGLLDRGADHHLQNWAKWMKHYNVGIGFKHKSVGLACMTSSTFDDIQDQYDLMNRKHARIADAIVDSLDGRHQASIRNTYLCDAWTFRGDPTVIFLDAAGKFWELAQRRGLS